MPGVGKSEAAAAYARSHRDVLAVGWWIVADTRLAVIVGLATLADRLKVGGEDQEQSAACVVELLGNRDDVLLVYDNVDDPADLASFLPGGPAVSCSPRVTRMWSDCHTRRG